MDRTRRILRSLPLLILLIAAGGLLISHGPARGAAPWRGQLPLIAGPAGATATLTPSPTPTLTPTPTATCTPRPPGTPTAEPYPWPSAASTASPTPTLTQTPTATQTATPATGIVYVTSSGVKYHADGCRYLKDSKIAATCNWARANGYTACGVCKPVCP